MPHMHIIDKPQSHASLKEKTSREPIKSAKENSYFLHFRIAVKFLRRGERLEMKMIGVHVSSSTVLEFLAKTLVSLLKYVRNDHQLICCHDIAP